MLEVYLHISHLSCIHWSQSEITSCPFLSWTQTLPSLCHVRGPHQELVSHGPARDAQRGQPQLRDHPAGGQWQRQLHQLCQDRLPGRESWPSGGTPDPPGEHDIVTKHPGCLPTHLCCPWHPMSTSSTVLLPSSSLLSFPSIANVPKPFPCSNASKGGKNNPHNLYSCTSFLLPGKPGIVQVPQLCWLLAFLIWKKKNYIIRT